MNSSKLIHDFKLGHAELVNCARDWLLKPVNTMLVKRGACSVVLTELTSSARETPDAIGWHSGGCVVVECKANRVDFKKDKHKFFRANSEYGMGNARYIMSPKSLIEPGELLEGWGLIEVGPNGKFKLVKTSAIFKSNFVDERRILLSLIRRLDLKTEGEHVAIKMYEVKGSQTPRATGTIVVDS